MYLRRKIDQFLSDWHANPDRLPLIVKGPRQIGKTESILHFARAAYGSVIEINFVEEPAYRNIAAESYRVENILKNITLIDPAKRFVWGGAGESAVNLRPLGAACKNPAGFC